MAVCRMHLGQGRAQGLVRALMPTALLLAVLVGGLPETGRAQQPVRLDTDVSVDSVVVGERFTVALTAARDAAVDVSFPTLNEDSLAFGDLEGIRRSAVSTRSLNGTRVMDSVAYEVTTFALDSVRVPALPVRVVADGDTLLENAPPRTVTVVSVVPSGAKGLHGVAPLASFPQPWWTWGILALTVTGLLAGVIYLWWNRRRGAEASPPGQPAAPQTPYEAVTSRMRQLESYDLSDPDAVKPFYVELSNALRVYLARELGVSALERTTREVAEVLEHRPDVSTEAATRLRAVLDLADLVKFAGIRPTADDHEKALREARAALDAIEAAPRSSVPDAVDEVASAG